MKMQVFQKVTCSWKCPALFILFSYFPLVYIYWTKLWASLWDSYMYIICFYVIFLKPIEMKEDKYSTSWGSDKNLAMKAAETKWKKTKQTNRPTRTHSECQLFQRCCFILTSLFYNCPLDIMCIWLCNVHISHHSPHHYQRANALSTHLVIHKLWQESYMTHIIESW